MQGSRIERRRDSLADWREIPETLSAADGEIIAQIDFAALTANNVTYAVHGAAPLFYWRFFPASDDAWGVVPLWGFGTVVESRNPAIAVGSRFYGYWPSASHLRLKPGPLKANGFSDMAEHRQGLAPVYNAYRRVAAATSGEEPLFALFQPLFGTAFVLDHVLKDTAGDATIILTSASSKTALGTAFSLSRRPGARVTGLTSAANRDFVASTGYYTTVLSYDEIGRLDPDSPSILVDFAGNGPLKAKLHRHLKGLKASHIVGNTHWDTSGESELPGPRPALFFAPSAWEERAKKTGPAAFEAELSAALQSFLKTVPAWLKVENYHGAQGHAQAFDDLLSGRAPAERGAIWHP